MYVSFVSQYLKQGTYITLRDVVQCISIVWCRPHIWSILFLRIWCIHFVLKPQTTRKKMFHFRKINWMRRRPLISHVNTQTHTKRCVNLCQKRLALNVSWVDVSLYVWKSGSVKSAYLMSCCQHHLTDWRMKSLCWVALRVFLLFISIGIWIVLACNSAIHAILLNVIHKQTNGKTLKINCIYSHYRDCHSMLYILQMLCHVKVLKVYYI